MLSLRHDVSIQSHVSRRYAQHLLDYPCCLGPPVPFSCFIALKYMPIRAALTYPLSPPSLPCLFLPSDKNMWITNRWQIAKKYILGSFLIDFVSILPFDVVGMVMGVSHAFAYSHLLTLAPPAHHGLLRRFRVTLPAKCDPHVQIATFIFILCHVHRSAGRIDSAAKDIANPAPDAPVQTLADPPKRARV